MSPGTGMYLRYDPCSATPNLIPGTFAELVKYDSLGALVSENLKPVGARKFLFAICFLNANDVTATIEILGYSIYHSSPMR